MRKTGQPVSRTWRRGKKEHLFTEISWWLLLDIASIFFSRIEEGRLAFEEENEILQRDIEKNSNIILQNQEQVAVSITALVVKTSPCSCCSGKSRISNKNSSSGSREWTHNETIELIAIWDGEEALYNIRDTDYFIKQKRNNDSRQY